FAGPIIPEFRGASAEPRRLFQSSREQVKEAPDQAADQCPVYADVLQVTTDNEFNPVREAAGVPLAHDLYKEFRQSAAPGYDFQSHCLDRAIDPFAHCLVSTQMVAEGTDRGAERSIDA